MRSWIARRTLRAFAGRYGYDVSYLEMLLNESPSAFFKFAPLMKASAHREVVPVNDSSTAVGRSAASSSSPARTSAGAATTATTKSQRMTV